MIFKNKNLPKISRLIKNLFKIKKKIQTNIKNSRNSKILVIYLKLKLTLDFYGLLLLKIFKKKSQNFY